MFIGKTGLEGAGFIFEALNEAGKYVSMGGDRGLKISLNPCCYSTYHTVLSLTFSLIGL